ncbi:MAG: orotate phosphoribosyltransferase [Promethearchaeota archaeon]
MLWAEEKEKLGKEILELLYDANMIDTWYKSRPEGWILFSGLWSPLYINLRHLGSFPSILKKIGYALGRLIQEECNNIDLLIGIASAGVPIATAISLENDIPMSYTRKLEGVKTLEDFQEKISEYGQHNLVEGIIKEGDNVALVDDLVTKLGSKLIALEQLKTEASKRNINITCKNIIVILDREQGAKELAKKNGLVLSSLIPFNSKGIHWLKDKFSDIENQIINDYLINTEKYQDIETREELKSLSIKN